MVRLNGTKLRERLKEHLHYLNHLNTKARERQQENRKVELQADETGT